MSAIRSPPVVPIRDDAGTKSQSTVERDFIRASALKDRCSSLRTDGRRWDQVRPTRLQLVRGDNTASCTVQWGSRVTGTCTGLLIPPYPDRPSQGVVTLSVDLSPGASTSFRPAQPVSTGGGTGNNKNSSNMGMPEETQKRLTNRLLRSLERILLTGGTIDTEALCVTAGAWVWNLQLTVTVVDAAGGNWLDASVLACLAALRHYRKPAVEIQQSAAAAAGGDSGSSSNNTHMTPILMPAHLKEPTPLPIHHTPLAISFALLDADESVKGGVVAAAAASRMDHDEEDDAAISTTVVALMDPNHREELVAAYSLVTIAMNVHGEICLLDYGGGCELPVRQLRQLHAAAAAALQHQLCPHLETCLQQADEQALSERLQQLQQQQQQQEEIPELPPLPVRNLLLEDDNDEDLNMAYHQSTRPDDDILHVLPFAPDDQAVVQRAQTQAQEAYRRQALDYNRGHVVTKIREDDDNDNAKPPVVTRPASSLLAAMLQSVQQQQQQQPASMASTESDPASTQMAMTTATKKEPPPSPAAREASTRNVDHDDRPQLTKSTGKSAPKPSPVVQPSDVPSAQPQVAAVTAMETDDDDEEPVTMQLESEFRSIVAPTLDQTMEIQTRATTTTSTPHVDTTRTMETHEDDNDDIDDLADAIKSKKKKKSKKTKK